MGYQGTVQSVSPFKFNIVSSLWSYKFSIMSFPLQTQLSEQVPHHQIEVFYRRLSFEKKPQSTKTTWASGSDFHSPYLLHGFFYFNSKLWLYGEVCITKSQKTEISGLVYRWLCMIRWYYLKVDDHSTILCRRMVRENLPISRTSSSMPGCLFERRDDKRCGSTLILEQWLSVPKLSRSTSGKLCDKNSKGKTWS